MTLSIQMSWKQAARIAIIAMENGTDEGKRLAKAELLRMADVADFAVDLQAELAARDQGQDVTRDQPIIPAEVTLDDIEREFPGAMANDQRDSDDD